MRMTQLPNGSDVALAEVFSPSGHGIVLRDLGVAARADSVILITGEGCTGKSMVARTVHHLSGHRSGPFIEFDCSVSVSIGPLRVSNSRTGKEPAAV